MASRPISRIEPGDGMGMLARAILVLGRLVASSFRSRATSQARGNSPFSIYLCKARRRQPRIFCALLIVHHAGYRQTTPNTKRSPREHPSNDTFSNRDTQSAQRTITFAVFTSHCSTSRVWVEDHHPSRCLSYTSTAAAREGRRIRLHRLPSTTCTAY